MRRRSIHGTWLTGSVFKTKCHDCGMPTLAADEFHPYEACREFKWSHDSRTVEPLFEGWWAVHNTGTERDK